MYITSSTSIKDTRSGISLPTIRFAAPEFSLLDLHANKVSLSELRGKVILINFWASWCPPCQAEMPALQSVYNDMSDMDCSILAVNDNTRDDLAAINLFLQEQNLSLPVFMDLDGTVSRGYQVIALPTSFFIDRNGVIKKVTVGQKTDEYIKGELLDLLHEAP